MTFCFPFFLSSLSFKLPCQTSRHEKYKCRLKEVKNISIMYTIRYETLSWERCPLNLIHVYFYTSAIYELLFDTDGYRRISCHFLDQKRSIKVFSVLQFGFGWNLKFLI